MTRPLIVAPGAAPGHARQPPGRPARRRPRRDVRTERRHGEPLAPVRVDPVGDRDLGLCPAVAGCVVEDVAHLVEHAPARSVVGQHGDVAHRREPLDDTVARQRLRVLERRIVERAEAMAIDRVRVGPALVVAPRRALLDAVHDRPQPRRPSRRSGRARSRSGRAARRGGCTRASSRERAVGVEPVERLGHGDGVERRRSANGSARPCPRRAGTPGTAARSTRAHPVDRLDREELGAGGARSRGELAGAGGQVAARACRGASREVLGEPGDRVGRVRRAGALVGLRAVAEAALRDVMNGIAMFAVGQAWQRSDAWRSGRSVHCRGGRTPSCRSRPSGPHGRLAVLDGTGAGPAADRRVAAVARAGARGGRGRWM